jgi:sigma-B regulation protein RsbU (phosphoserine phosphatase)
MNAPSMPAEQTATAVTPSAGADLLASARVLVVDDSRLMRVALIRALGDLGVTQTAEARHGLDALNQIREQSFDLMLLDMEMPEMSGIELLRALRAEPALNAPPVIVISGVDQIENAVQCIEAGAEDYLTKTFNPTLLRARVTSSLEKKRLRDIEQSQRAQLEQEKARLERTQRRLDDELNEALKYVRSIFPAPTETPLKIDWFYQPSAELGGDSFGYHWIDDEHFAVYLLDVCGHGVGPALLSVTAINQIRSGSIPNVDMRDPGAVLAALSNIYLMSKQNDMYFTLWYGVYHAPSRTIRHASGGHPAALLLIPAADGSVTTERLLSSNLIIGAFEDVPYEAKTNDVPAGAQLVVLCDGCFEIQDTDGNELAYEDFEDFMRQEGHKPGALEDLFRWAQMKHGPGPLDDDFSIVRIQL